MKLGSNTLVFILFFGLALIEAFRSGNWPAVGMFLILGVISLFADNPKEKSKLWFKAKNYGWGWYPITWQGWLVTGVFVAVIVANFYRVDSVSHSVSDTLINFVPEAFILLLLLIFICYKKGEKPEWRWGGKKIK